MSRSNSRLMGFTLFFLIYELTIYLSNDMIMPAMLNVVRDFQGKPSDVALSLSLYVLGGSCLQIVLGPLADRIGKRPVMLAGNVLFLASTLWISQVHTMDAFLLARFVQGTGSCFIFIGYALVHEMHDDVEAVKITTLLSNTAIFAPLIGPVVGSAVITRFPWQAVFMIALALSLISLVGFWRTLPAGRTTGKHATPIARFKDVVASYGRILMCRRFMLGIVVAGLAIAPLTAWIGLSPLIVMGTLHESYGVYILYQFLVFTGFILSTFAIQLLKSDASLELVIRRGAWLSLLGMAAVGLFSGMPWLFMAGMFVYSAGFGLFNGALVRLSLNATGESMGLTSSAMSLLYCLYIALGLEVFNLVGDALHYSLASYAWCSAGFGLLVFFGLMGLTRSPSQVLQDVLVVQPLPVAQDA